MSPGRGAPSADPPRGARAERRPPTCGSGRSGGSSRSAREAGAPTTMLGADGERGPAGRAALWRPRPAQAPPPRRVATPQCPRPPEACPAAAPPIPWPQAPPARGTASRSHAQIEPRLTAPPATLVPGACEPGLSGRREGGLALRPGAEAPSRPGQACPAVRLGVGRATPVVAAAAQGVAPEGAAGTNVATLAHTAARKVKGCKSQDSGVFPACCSRTFILLSRCGRSLPGAGQGQAQRESERGPRPLRRPGT